MSEEEPLIALYKEELHLHTAHFSLIAHEDALVATVYKVTLPTGGEYILKICSQAVHYLREVYCLNYFAGKLAVPRILLLVLPQEGIHGALLMQCLSGHVLKKADLNEKMTYEIGASLARIHLERVKGFGDLTNLALLNSDPRVHFTLKFEEGLNECSVHFPEPLIRKCRELYDQYVELLLSVDGPCIVHGDFRPGNVFFNKGKLQGIIDWSSAHAGFAEEDLCAFELGAWSSDLKIKNSFLSGYASIRPVPNYQMLLPLLSLSRAVATLGFTIKTRTWETQSASLYQQHLQVLEDLLKED